MSLEKRDNVFKCHANSSSEDSWLFDSKSHSGLFGGKDWFKPEAKKGQELEDYIEELTNSVRHSIDSAIDEITPWFFSALPQFYYDTTPGEEKVRDLRALITGQIFERRQTIQLWNKDRSKTTFLAYGGEDALLHEIAEKVKKLSISNGTSFKSTDDQLLISSFQTGAYKKADLNHEKVARTIGQARSILEAETKDQAAIDDFLLNLDQELVLNTAPARLARLFLLSQLLDKQENTISHLIPNYHKGMARFDIAYKNMPINESYKAILDILKRYNFKIQRCLSSLVRQHRRSQVTVYTFIMEHESGQPIDEKFIPFLKASKAAKTLKWVDSDLFDFFMNKPLDDKEPFSLNEVNLVRSISGWIHIFLSKKNPYTYTEERIFKLFSKQTGLLKNLVLYYKLRVDPRLQGESKKRLPEIKAHLQAKIRGIADSVEKEIFEEAMNFIGHILKTNYFTPHKTGLAFRMDPDCLNPEYYPNKPFGFFYLVGRGYRGFQVRYRDTARGGLRIVMPKDSGQHEGSLLGSFDEVIGLSYAQQMKNKDIPEGGSKAVIILAPGADKRNAAIGAVDSILNLITPDPETGKLHHSIIDHYGKEESIYLGPDENVTNDLIDKFISLAQNQGYRYANAFMSSKPDSGINHKEYGVTSEGLNVFLDNMLKKLNIDPHSELFTVKMTGGPDGDVAGNELKFLHREYGENARVTAIADGFGAAYDPQGLNWNELLRLVEEERPIRDFDGEFLSNAPEAFVIAANTPEHIKKRNNLYAEVVSDIFIPAGGRPYTVNDSNWQDFLTRDGVPSAKAVVEGANIFFTEEARARLQEKGLLMFKDSSANKCGVICSSFEILSSLLLTPDEFAEIKADYVEQVISKLRAWADLEAKLLLKEYRERGGSKNLVDLSKLLSQVINRVTDLIAEHVDQLSDEEFNIDLFNNIILNYMPDAIRESYEDRILRDLPKSYQRALVSAEIASTIVYREGISWLDMLPDKNIPEVIKTYMYKEQRVIELVQALRKADLEGRDEITRILEIAGARTLTLLEQKESL
ncbi:MAG: hypothetical protein CSA81_03510 [Acidobacteria bacterium]|nr:MAG: hypothetical protein CSA81_03510 [Acidobacteriota bacterium]